MSLERHRPADGTCMAGFDAMARVLLTGMSATGKSSILAELRTRGHRTVETDDEAWSYERATPGGLSREQLWWEDRMAALLGDDSPGLLFVAGCAGNQGAFYDRFDAVVLLSVPVDVLLRRLASRTTNRFGKRATERARILADLAEVEPLLRATATVELDTRRPLLEVADAIEALAREARGD